MKEALRLAQVPAQLTVSRDGLEATRYLQTADDETRPDLVLLDLNLPRRSGREVLRDVKRSPALCDIPVVVLSSSRAEEDRRQAEALQAAAFLTKPDNLAAYIELVRGLKWLWNDSVAALPRSA